MAIDNLTSLTPNKQNYPEIIPPSNPLYYLSAEEYNKLLRTIQQLIDDYNLKVATLSQGLNLPLIPSGDTTTEPTDGNIFTAARVLKEIRSILLGYDDYYISKRNDDTTEGKIRFNKGLQLGDYQNGFRGGNIDQYGNAELNSLKLREWLEVPELRFNRVEIQMGDKWRSPGGGIIESVDTVNRIVTLKLEPGEYGAVSVNDLCMGIFHSMIPSNNANSNSDDSRNNRTIKGFATAYFKVEQLLNPSENNSRFRYSLRPLSARHIKQVHPEAFMHFAAFGNTTNVDRQSSAYETRTYQRFLINMNDWESTQFNVAAQFGDLTNLNTLGLSGLTGYSIYLNSVYFTGTIQQMKAPKIEFGTWWTWNGTEWVDSGVPAVIQPKDGLYATLINESLAVGRTDTNYLHTWAELHVFEGDRELVYNKIEANQRGTYTVSLVPTNIIPGDLVQTTLNGKTFLKTTPIMGIDENVNSGSILFRIKGIRLDGANFEFSTSQTFVKADSGLDGVSTEYIYTRTTTNAVPLKPASDNIDQFKPDNWTLDPAGVTPTLKFEWVARRQKIAGIWSAWSTPSPWARYVADGIDGKDGTDIEYIFIRNNDQTFSDESNRPPTSQTDDYVPTGWTDNPAGPTSTLQFEWVSKREKTGGAGGTGGIWGTFSIPALYSKWSKNGDKGDQGPPGSGVPVVYRGEYVSTNTYFGSTTRQDIVKYSNNYYIAKQTAGSFSGITPPPAGQNNAQWDSFGSSFESVATGLLLAEKANVAGFAFIDQKMISQSGVNAEGAQLNLGVDNTPPAGFIPNLKLDGNLGEIIAGAGKIKFNKDGSGYLANGNLRWETDGTLKFGPASPTIQFNPDGSGFLASSSISWDVSGNAFMHNIKGIKNGEVTHSRLGLNDKVWIEGDLQHQGYNHTESRGWRFLSSDIWCRGTFGARERSTAVIQGGLISYYTNGLSGNSIAIQLVSQTINSETFYRVPTSGSDGDTAGFPVDILIFKTAAQYVLEGVLGTVVKVSNMSGQIITIFLNGSKTNINAGLYAEFQNIGNLYPGYDHTYVGAGWVRIG